jgi:hypothetical protein
MTAKKRHLGQVNGGETMWQDSQGITSGTRPLRQVNQDKSILTGKPGQVSRGRTERTSQDMTATTGQQRQESQVGQDNQETTARTGLDSHERTGQDAGTGQPHNTAGIVHPE